MSTRSTRRQQAKEQAKAYQGGVTAREVPGGEYDVSINPQQLPPPSREFYANCARTVSHRPDVITFVFGQLSPADTGVASAIGLDVPLAALKLIIPTLNQEFRDNILARGIGDIGNPSKWDSADVISYPAHVVRILINDFMSVLDFYEFTPAFGGPPVIVPVVRIKGISALVPWFMSVCDGTSREAAR